MSPVGWSKTGTMTMRAPLIDAQPPSSHRVVKALVSIVERSVIAMDRSTVSDPDVHSAAKQTLHDLGRSATIKSEPERFDR
jgi:hypothetical protein